MKDCIVIKSLEVSAKVGVPDEERAVPQRLEIDLVLEADFRDLPDDIACATDYAAVAGFVARECSCTEFRLIESLAAHLAREVLAGFPRIAAVEIEIRKFILPATGHVAVRTRRERD